MYYNSKKRCWVLREFKGTKWQKINDIKQRYLRNAYRVLLTRARQGMVIFVPEVDGFDHTRPQELYDQTWSFFEACGFNKL